MVHILVPHEHPQCSRKRRTLDYISNLPDCILQRILSYLVIKDAIKTSVLSKRWLSVWAGIPVLNFCHCTCKHLDEFASFVDKTLRLYTGPNVEKLLIRFKYSKSFSSQVDQWVHFAMRHNVEELYLDFGGGTIEYPYKDVYQLPQSIYSNSSLRILNTVLCYFKPNEGVSWTSLKFLSIGYTELNNGIVFKILVGSPRLEFLKLQHCKGDNQLVVSSSSLKELVIDSFLGGAGSVMEISGPSIRILRFYGYMVRRKFVLTNVSALVVADLNFVMQTDTTDLKENYRSHCNLLQELLGNLCHVQKLTIGTWCLQVLSVCEVECLLLPSFKCKSLTLDTKINNQDGPGIASLLESSPDLEELVINLMPIDNSELAVNKNFSYCYNYDGGQYMTSKCLSLQLKKVEISGYGPRLAEIEFFCLFVEFLLKNARVLEKMVIYAQTDIFSGSGSWFSVGVEQELSDLLEASQLFLSYPRASPKAVVLLTKSSN